MSAAFPFRPLAQGAIALAVLSISGAQAAEWKITPRIEAREAFTDNARLSRGSKTSDFVTRIAPGIDLKAQGGRVLADIDYELAYDAYARADDLNGFRHNLRGTGRVEFVEDRLFLDLGAFAGESPVLARGRASAIDRSLGGASSQFTSYSVSPYWRTRFGPWAEAEARYRFSQVAVTRDRGNIDAAPAPALLSDTDIHQASGFVAGGENFNRLRWRLAADHAETRVSNGGGATPGTGGSATSLRRQSASAQPSYVVTRWLSLLGTLGYDHIESSGFRKDLDGSFWNGGVRLTPSQRTSFELTYGERYGGPNWASSLTAATEAGTALTLAYRETVENQALQSASGFSFLTRDPSGALIDTRTGLPFVGRDPFFDQSDRTFLSRGLTLSLRMPMQRDTVTVSAQHVLRETEFGGVVAAPGRDDTTDAILLGWQRRLSEVISGNAQLSYSNTRTDPNGAGGATQKGTSKTLGMRVGVDHDLNETLRGGIGLAHLRRDVSGPQISPGEITGAYSETVLFVTLRKTF
jgi:uncharacterized protein (PEP-CTERM system associated)